MTGGCQREMEKKKKEEEQQRKREREEGPNVAEQDDGGLGHAEAAYTLNRFWNVSHCQRFV